MKLSTLSVIWAIAYSIFGLGLLVIPATFMAPFGVTFEDSGILMARILGSALFASAIAFYINRNIPVTEKSQYNIILSGTIYNIVDLPIVLMATLDGTMNALGWFPVGLHLFLAATMGYFVFKK
ncbi:MAG: hypothetical protein H6565_17260 [Lewinellaceae bacterium]|nr:hypothetical protein [Lewinellaceae bacterium]